MRQILIIPCLCYTALLCEFCLFNLFGRWGEPHLLLLVIIFFELYSGIRYSLWAALFAGVFKDCFTTMPFGTHIFTYFISAYLTTFIRKNYYERGSSLSKLLLVLVVGTVNHVTLGLLHQMVYDDIRWGDVWGSLWLPEMLATLLVALYFFARLRALARVLRF
jgi:rod shape-determining protein MreD